MTYRLDDDTGAETGRHLSEEARSALADALWTAFTHAEPDGLIGPGPLRERKTMLDGDFDLRRVAEDFVSTARKQGLL